MRRALRDPWRRTPVGELQEPLLPRWFAILAVLAVPAALAVLVTAFVVSGPDEVPVAERRPPPARGLTHDVGALATGESAAARVTTLCPMVNGTRVAGTDVDRRQLTAGLAPLCDVDLDARLDRLVTAFGDAGGVVRFAQFEATGVDSAARVEQEPAVILVNAKFSRTDPAWIAPLVVHDLVVLAGAPGSAETALQARRAEAAVCLALFDGRRPPRGCDDARALLELDDPLAALRAAGYQ